MRPSAHQCHAGSQTYPANYIPSHICCIIYSSPYARQLYPGSSATRLQLVSNLHRQINSPTNTSSGRNWMVHLWSQGRKPDQTRIFWSQFFNMSGTLPQFVNANKKNCSLCGRKKEYQRPQVRKTWKLAIEILSHYLLFAMHLNHELRQPWNCKNFQMQPLRLFLYLFMIQNCSIITCITWENGTYIRTFRCSWI